MLSWYWRVLAAAIVHRLLRCNNDDVAALAYMLSHVPGLSETAGSHRRAPLGVGSELDAVFRGQGAVAVNKTLTNHALLGLNIMTSEMYQSTQYPVTTQQVRRASGVCCCCCCCCLLVCLFVCLLVCLF